MIKKAYGFTMVEMLMIAVILSTIVMIIFPFLRVSYKTWEVGDRRVEILQNARIAMDKVSDVIRQAKEFSGVSIASNPKGFIELTTADNNGVLHRVKFYYKDDINNPGYGWLWVYDENLNDLTVNDALLAGPVSEVRFTCYAADGTVTVELKEIKLVKVELAVCDEEGKLEPVRLSCATYGRVDRKKEPRPAWSHALFAGNGNLAIGGGSSISGNVYAKGNVQVEAGAKVINGEVCATGTVSGDGVYTIGELPDPLPTMPVLDTSYYDSLIRVAAQKPRQDMKLSGAYNLNGQTIYVNGDLIVLPSTQVNGPGTIVVNGRTIAVKTWAGVMFQQRITAIAKDEFIIIGAALFTGDSILYSGKEVFLTAGAEVDGSVLCPVNISISSSVKVTGLVYAGNQVDVDGTVNGSVVAGSFAPMRGVKVTYDESYIPAIPPGLQ